MCANTYSNRERFHKVIAEAKWCSFFAAQCRRYSIADSAHVYVTAKDAGAAQLPVVLGALALCVIAVMWFNLINDCIL